MVGRSPETAGLRGRCLGEREAAADERHSEWSALPPRGRWITPKPELERPGLPGQREVAAARDELVGVVRAAMAAELERIPCAPRDQPAGTAVGPSIPTTHLDPP